MKTNIDRLREKSPILSGAGQQKNKKGDWKMIIFIEDKENGVSGICSLCEEHKDFFFKHRHAGCDIVFRVKDFDCVPKWLSDISFKQELRLF